MGPRGPPSTGLQSGASRAPCSRKASPRPGQAIEIGFRDGRETLALLEAGCRVLAIDPAPAAAEVLRSQVPAHVAGRLEIRSVPAEDADLLPFDLLYAGFSLPFLGAEAFERFWNAARDRLRPGGILVVNFFGPRDSWAGREGMRFVDVDEVPRLVDGLELVALDEEDQDGNSFLGPKRLARLRRHRPATAVPDRMSIRTTDLGDDFERFGSAQRKTGRSGDP